ncbi:MAG: TolC family protein [Planctomycetota bacterium]
MLRLSMLLPCLLLPLLLPACSSAPEDAGFNDVSALVARAIPQRVHWRRGGPEDQQAADFVKELLSQELTAESAVQVALLENPSLQATFEDLGVAQADLVQAGLLRNPLLEFEVRGPDRPRHPLELHLIQEFVDVFSRPLRKRIAAEEFEAVRLRVAQDVLNLAGDVRTAFYSLQAAEHELRVGTDIVAATAASADFATLLRQAGNISDGQLAEEVAQHTEARLALLAVEAERVQHREALTTLLGVGASGRRFTIAPRLPELPAEEVAFVDLERLAREHRLDLGAAEHDLQAALAEAGVADENALLPSLALGLHFEREPDGSSTTGVMIEVPLPIFDQGQAPKAHAAAHVNRARQRWFALAAEIGGEVRVAQARLSAARASAEALERELIPLRARIVEEAQLSYNAMQIGMHELLAARRAELEAGGRQVAALRDYWLARTALERAVGGSLNPTPLPTASSGETP